MLSIDRSLCIRCGACARACPMGIFHMKGGSPEVGDQKNCMQCGHCSAACPVRAVRLDGVSPEQFYPLAPSTALEQLICGRRSVRHFTGRLPDKAVLSAALDAAGYCPSAKNRRPYRWVVLYGVARTARARDLAVEWAAATGSAPELPGLAARGLDLVTCGAPCLISLHIREDDPRATVDAAVAMATAELLLTERGLGTCWAGYFNRACAGSPDLRALVGLEEGWKPACSLMVGYPDGERYPNLPYRPAADIRWIET